MNKIGNAIKTALTSIGTKIKSFFTNIRDKIKSWSNNIKNKLKNRGSKNSNVSNSSIQTQKDNSKVQTKDNNVFEPQENTYIYKPTENSIDNNIDADEPEQNQQIDSNEDNQATSFQTEKIQNIKINEEAGSVEYTTVDGKNYSVDINKVLDNKKGIYKDFSISKKCKDLTGSFIKGRRLEKSLNPLVINGLNNDEDIDKYINCVNNEEKLFFDLEHNTQNSKLGFLDRNKMRKIAEIEQKLGADVQIEPGFFSKIKTQFTELFKKQDTDKENEEKMIAKQYKEAVKMLKDKAINSLYESVEYASIENNLEKCANWYMNNGNFKRADKCIDLLSNMIKDKHKNYYLPKYNEEVKKGNEEYATERFAQEDGIKRCNLVKLRIKRNWLGGNQDKARELYIKLINDSGIKLTREEYEKSILHDGLLNGTYSKLVEEKVQNPDGTYTTNIVFKDIPIIGNERALAKLEKIRNSKQNPVVINTAEPDKEPQEAEQNSMQAEEQKNVIPVINNIEENEQEASNEQQNIEEQEKSESEGSNQITKEKINELISKYDKLDNNKKYKKGLAITYIMALATYLEENDDREIQSELDNELIKLQKIAEQSNKQFAIYENMNINILAKLIQIYKHGKKATDGKRIIIDADKNKCGYYLYLANKGILQYEKALLTEPETKKRIQELPQIIEQAKLEGNEIKINMLTNNLRNAIITHKKLVNAKKNWQITETQMDEIKQGFKKNRDVIEYEYTNSILENKGLKNITGIEKLIADANLIQDLSRVGYSGNNSDYLNLVIAKEKFSRVNDETNQKELYKIMKTIETKREQGDKVDSRVLELLGDIYYTGIKRNGFDELFVEPNKILAEKVYSRLLEENKDIENSDIYKRLLNLYNDNTLPIYNPSKAKQLEDVMKQKGIQVQYQESKKNETETGPYTYVCSDIHGGTEIFNAIISQLKENDKLYVLGDAIDSGIKVLQEIIKKQKEGKIEFIIGNHEYALLKYDIFKNLDDNPLLEREQYIKDTGHNIIGNDTFEALKKLSSDERNKIKEFLLNSLAYKQISVKGEDVFLVHAKAPQEDLQKKHETIREMLERGKKDIIDDILNARAGGLKSAKTHELWQEEDFQRKGMFTIVGHTGKNSYISYNGNGTLYIDTSVGQAKSLVRLEDGKVMYFDPYVEREKLKAKESEQR